MEPAAKKQRAPDSAAAAAAGGASAGAAAAAAEDDVDALEAAAEEVARQRKQKVVRSGRECPFIDTVDRRTLDFDFEKLCSVTLVNQNCYCCLVCGKYFQGRARGSPAYTHSLDVAHSVYMNMTNGKLYCLPDDYEVVDPSLDDVVSNMRPTFTREQIRELDSRTRTSLALDGSEYLPGLVGFNNLKQTDGINVVVQSLMRVVPFRDFLLDASNYSHCKSLLLQQLGVLARKNWHAANYKSHISPHEFVQACSVASKSDPPPFPARSPPPARAHRWPCARRSKRFRPGARSDPADFLAWVLNSLQRDLHKANKKAAKKAKPGAKTPKGNVINSCFRGAVHVMTESISAKKSNVSAAAVRPPSLPSAPRPGPDSGGDGDRTTLGWKS